MILIGNQRGGGKDLAQHLMKTENEHIDIFELRGYVADTLHGAFNESYAISRGTRCKQYLFSLSLNPPPDADVGTTEFMRAIDHIEGHLGLAGQPRAVVFHEKKARRHAHAVWSRIDARNLKAIQLSHSHRRLMTLARELFVEHGWTMPSGLAQTGDSDPRNFSLAQWQQAIRCELDPRDIKAALQDAWAISDGKSALIAALKDRGYWLARGDRRGFVVLDLNGNVYSLPRWVGLKVKDIRARLGPESDMPSISEVHQSMRLELRPVFEKLRRDLLTDVKSQNQTLRGQTQALVQRQRRERELTRQQIDVRWWAETRLRQARFRQGLRGLWDWARGENKRIKLQNEHDARNAKQRDIEEWDRLVAEHRKARRQLEIMRNGLAQEVSRLRQSILNRLQKGGCESHGPNRAVNLRKPQIDR